MGLKHQKAAKDHICDLCQRTIPAGTGYWRNYKPGRYDRKEHSNCAEYEDQPATAINRTPAETDEEF